MSADVTLLSEVPIFALLDPEERATLGGLLDQRHYDKGETIFSYGDAGDSLYIVRVQPFYLRKLRAVELAIVFAAFVRSPREVVLGTEHEAAEWLSVDEALSRYAFPAERASLREIAELLATGDAGPVDDVMRIF